MKPREKCLSLQEIEKRLVEAKIAPTAQRLAICHFVLCEADHPTAEEVKAWADKNFPKMSLATVYNTLGTLVRAGILKELKLPHHDKIIYDANVGEHYHFLDEETGEVFDLDPSEVEITPKLKKSFKVKQVEVLLRGTRSRAT